MTASDPRVGEIQADAVEAAARVMLDKMYDDKTLRVDDEDRDIMRAALEAASPHMHAYLLAELADRDEKLARVEAIASGMDKIADFHMEILGHKDSMAISLRQHAENLRAAVAALNESCGKTVGLGHNGIGTCRLTRGHSGRHRAAVAAATGDGES